MFKVKWKYLLPLFFLAVFFYPVHVLEVGTKKSEEILLRRRVSPGDEFQFQYTHSVSKTPVSGRFLITSKRMIKNIETQFFSYGPGLPSTGEGVAIEKGALKAITDAEEMKQFSFFVSPFTNQSLKFRDRRIDFSSLKEGEVVCVEVRQYPIGEYYLYGTE